MKALSKLSAKIDGLQKKAEILKASMRREAGVDTVDDCVEESEILYSNYLLSLKTLQKEFLQKVTQRLSALEDAGEPTSTYQTNNETYLGVGFIMPIGEDRVNAYFINDKFGVRGLKVLIGKARISVSRDDSVERIADKIIEALKR